MKTHFKFIIAVLAIGLLYASAPAQAANIGFAYDSGSVDVGDGALPVEDLTILLGDAPKRLDCCCKKTVTEWFQDNKTGAPGNMKPGFPKPYYEAKNKETKGQGKDKTTTCENRNSDTGVKQNQGSFKQTVIECKDVDLSKATCKQQLE